MSDDDVEIAWFKLACFHEQANPAPEPDRRNADARCQIDAGLPVPRLRGARAEPVTKATTQDRVLNEIVAFDEQASRCFQAAQKLGKLDLSKAKRLIALGLQALNQSSAKRRIWNDMHTTKAPSTEMARLEAFADRMVVLVKNWERDL